jgi:hypothetical protein
MNYKISMPTVSKFTSSKSDLPSRTPILVRDAGEGGRISTVIIQGDIVIWFESDGSILHSTRDNFIDKGDYEVIRMYEPGDTLTVTVE